MGIAVLIIIGSLLLTGSGCMLISLIIDYEHKPIPPPVPPARDLVQNFMEEEIEQPEPEPATYDDDFFDIDDDLLE